MAEDATPAPIPMYRSIWESYPLDLRGYFADGVPYVVLADYAAGRFCRWPVRIVPYRPVGALFFLRRLQARLRGCWYRWPRSPATASPPHPADVSWVGLGSISAADVVYFWQRGWDPWCVQRTPDGDHWLFRVRELSAGSRGGTAAPGAS